MPTLDWIGKKAVVNHHREVPYRLVHCDGELSAGDPDAGNLLVQGDNLEALKALLPYYAGKVKCIYIDPPYNTGNEGWVYNDNVASPEIKAWLGKVVGKEAEDLSRHDKWLCMMYPRLRLLREFLREDGVLFASIDANEIANFQLVLEDVFSGCSQIAIPVVNNMKGRNDREYISTCHEYLVMVAKTDFVSHGLPLSQQQKARFKHVDEEGYRYELRDLRKRGGADTRQERPQLWFPVYKHPETNELSLKPRDGWIEIWPMKKDGTEGCWRWGKSRVEKYLSSLIPSYARANDKWNLSYRIYLDVDREESLFEDDPEDYSEDYDDETGEAIERTTKPKSFWWGPELSTDNAGKQLKDIFDGRKPFDYPKPISLVQKIMHMIGDEEALILDSFAGSGTTGQAVLDLNKKDGGNRRFILVEMDEKIASEITAKRLRRVINGYDKGGDPGKPVEGLGGGFRYCRLGTPLFNEFGDIDEAVSFPDLAAHVFFSETGAPLPKKVDGSTPLIGQHKDKIVYLLFSPAEQGFPREAAGNVLTPDALASLPSAPEGFDGERVVYAEGCTVSPERLKAEGVVFKQIPYQIEGA
ncbi:site-specific DNA-methyltransferase [Ruegeria lacuscaerulensis ITI-1157]|nr:site-specific DNA-methyltransferase [Ruegeria lacuscaerulensis ITI-1157]SHI33978.1 site-specific DNA-methyltransferase (adenine-specific)/adenine-specific DNA-methyltransferase [Ruegeria lacuscaerulensis ITI-1157]